MKAAKPTFNQDISTYLLILGLALLGLFFMYAQRDTVETEIKDTLLTASLTIEASIAETLSGR